MKLKNSLITCVKKFYSEYYLINNISNTKLTIYEYRHKLQQKYYWICVKFIKDSRTKFKTMEYQIKISLSNIFL